MSTSKRNRLRKSSRAVNDNHPFGYQASHFSVKMPGHVDLAPKKAKGALSAAATGIRKGIRKIVKGDSQ